MRNLPRSAREDAPGGRGRTAGASTSDGWPHRHGRPDKVATAPLPKADKPAALASNKRASLAPPLDDLDDTRPARWGLPQVALIAAFLVVSAAGWLLYRSDLANYVGLKIPPATQASDDLAQVQEALQQEREKSEKLAGELQATTTAGKNVAHGQELNELQRALRQEHDKTEQLAASWPRHGLCTQVPGNSDGRQRGARSAAHRLAAGAAAGQTSA